VQLPRSPRAADPLYRSDAVIAVPMERTETAGLLKILLKLLDSLDIPVHRR
jgi:hypothetical protein